MSSNTSDITISVKGLTKTYRLFDHPGDRVKQFFSLGLKQYHREFTALKDVSFEIRKGETVGIIGRNGSGKSTLLQLICGILKPTSGSVHVNGRISALLELGAGFNPEFTGRENVYFQGALMGFTEAQMNERFDDIAAFADIGNFIDQPVRTYSSGMFVRLAFAVAIHLEPDVLIVDEALGVGDSTFKRKCFQFLQEFRKTRTLLLVSHDIQSIKGLCDCAIWLDCGCIQLFGLTTRVCDSYLSGSITSILPPVQSTDNVEIEDYVDQRLSYLNLSNLRNDLKISPFKEYGVSFGESGASIVDVRMTDGSDKPFKWVIGGELVTLRITAAVKEKLAMPIIGFNIKNDLGQPLFGDNTYISYANNPIQVNASDYLIAEFRFRMPRFPLGNYSISVAVAEGSQESHSFQHWISDAICFESSRSSVDGSLIGIPMIDITLKSSSVDVA